MTTITDKERALYEATLRALHPDHSVAHAISVASLCIVKGTSIPYEEVRILIKECMRRGSALDGDDV